MKPRADFDLITAWTRVKPAHWVRLIGSSGFFEGFAAALARLTVEALPELALPIGVWMDEPSLGLSRAIMRQVRSAQDAPASLLPAWLAATVHLDHSGVPELAAALRSLADHPSAGGSRLRFLGRAERWEAYKAADSKPTATNSSREKGESPKSNSFDLGGLATMIKDWTTPKAQVRTPAKAVSDPSERKVSVLKTEPLEVDSDEFLRDRTIYQLREPLRLVAGIDPEMLRTVLGLLYPWMDSATAAICADATLIRMAGQAQFRFRPLLLVGPPGIGKTRYALSIGSLVGSPVALYGAGGSSDPLALAGTARAFKTSQAALPVLVMAQHGIANPLIVVDEIDKVGASRHFGQISDVLLGMLEPTSAARFFDGCLHAEVDISNVNWLLTANDLGAISGPLRSRLRIVRVESPKVEDFELIYSGILKDIAQDLGVSIDDLPEIAPKLQADLNRRFGKAKSIRELRRAIEAVLSTAAGHRRSRTH